MYCMYCGQKISDDANFCINCGKAVVRVEKTVENNENISNDINVDSYEETHYEEVIIPEERKDEVIKYSSPGAKLGISAFVFSLIPLLSFISVILAITGLVVSSVEKGKNDGPAAKKGVVFSILGLVFGSIISLIVMLFI